MGCEEFKARGKGQRNVFGNQAWERGILVKLWVINFF